MNGSSDPISLEICLLSNDYTTISDNAFLHICESATFQTCRTKFQLGEALRHQDHDKFKRTAGISPRSATTLLLAFTQVDAKFQSEQKLELRAKTKRLSLEFFIDPWRTNRSPSRSEGTPGRLYSYDSFEECWDRKIITSIDTMCRAASDDAMNVPSSLDKIHKIFDETNHGSRTFSSGHCKTFLFSRSIATHRTKDGNYVLFALLTDLFPQSKWRSRLKLIQGFVGSMNNCVTPYREG